MAVEIKELIIKGVVGQDAMDSEEGLVLSRTMQQQMVADCVKQVLKTIKKGETR